MNSKRLILQSLRYHWRTNVAVVLGVIAATAVIGGAFIVGDSVRDSLRQMTLDRLGKVDYVLHGSRFFREDLAIELTSGDATIAPALVMDGSLMFVNTQKEITTRAGGVTVLGVDSQLNAILPESTTDLANAGSPPRHGLWDLLYNSDSEPKIPGWNWLAPTKDEVVLGFRAAEQLGVREGDSITAWIELPSSIPRDSLLGGSEDQTSKEIPFTVRAVLPESSKIGRFSLQANQQLPLVAFVSLDYLQSALEIGYVASSDRNPGRVARVNSLFVSTGDKAALTKEEAEKKVDLLNDQLVKSIQLQDLGLKLQPNEKHNYFSLESEQMILEDSLFEAGLKTAKSLEMSTSPVLVYLVNELDDAERVIEAQQNPVQPADAKPADAAQPADEEDQLYSMYSVVAGIDLDQLTQAPFGPFQYVGDPPAEWKNATDAIVLNQYLQQDLHVEVGDKVRLKYYEVGNHGELPEQVREFTVRGILKFEDTVADDRGLVPTVKGITDVENIGDWDQPFKMDLGRLTDRDHTYWKKHRATPKAFIPLAVARTLWKSRYGKSTSLRMAPNQNISAADHAAIPQQFEKQFRMNIDVASLGLSFQPIKFNGLEAASGTQDFSQLFAAFSFFLVLSAAILVNLLFRLGIERRAADLGLLAAVGVSPKNAQRLFLTEGLIVACVGSVIGVAAAIGYAKLMIFALTSESWWLGAIGTKFLSVSIKPVSLAMGFGASLVIAMFAIWWGLRGLTRISVRDLLSGVTDPMLTEEAQQRRGRKAWITGFVSAVIAVVLLIVAIFGADPDVEAFEGVSYAFLAFFIVAISALVASIAFLAAWLDSDHTAAVRGAGLIGIARLSLRNAARHRSRSVLSVGLIASATFVIIAIAAGHRNPAVEEPKPNSGNGGFWLVAQSSQGIIPDINTTAGRQKLRLGPFPTSEAQALIENMFVESFRVQPGEDASCLNIYKTRQPTILGVPQSMIERGGFKFIGAKEDNPWQLLNQKSDRIPVIGDYNTLKFSMKKSVGAEIKIENDVKLEVVGALDGSVFQGVLLMSEENFQKVFPERVGFEYFLIGSKQRDEPNSSAPEPAMPIAANIVGTKSDFKELGGILETSLIDYGFDTEFVSDRLTNFLAVQNTYLSTFQSLGGLGLLLGTLGLATVMLRNVLERRSELALLRAVGFRSSRLAILIACENAFLLIWGLLAGTASALLAMTPHLLTVGADVAWAQGILMLAGVLVAGMLAALMAVKEAVRTPMVAALRAE